MKIKRPWYYRHIFGKLRGIWRWSPERRKVLKEAQIGQKYTCSSCTKLYTRKNVAVDHKTPVIDPTKGFQNWDTYISNLFCESELMQILCKGCHAIKTKAEGVLRRKTRKEA